MANFSPFEAIIWFTDKMLNITISIYTHVVSSCGKTRLSKGRRCDHFIKIGILEVYFRPGTT